MTKNILKTQYAIFLIRKSCEAKRRGTSSPPFLVFNKTVLDTDGPIPPYYWSSIQIFKKSDFNKREVLMGTSREGGGGGEFGEKITSISFNKGII